MDPEAGTFASFQFVATASVSEGGVRHSSAQSGAAQRGEELEELLPAK